MHSILKIRKNDSAVSVVIGVILMVSVTVTIGATVFAYTSQSMQFTSTAVEQKSFSVDPSSGEFTVLEGKDNTNDVFEIQAGGYTITSSYSVSLKAGTTVSIPAILVANGYQRTASGTSMVVITNTKTNKEIVKFSMSGTVVPPEEFVFQNPSIPNGATDQPYTTLTFSIDIKNIYGTLFSYSFSCSNGQSKIEKDCVAQNGKYEFTIDVLQPNKQYTITVIATSKDGQEHKETYSFTTAHEPVINLPVTIDNINPKDKSTGQPLSFIWSCSLADPEGDKFMYTIECSNGASAKSDSIAGSGTYTLSLKNLEPKKDYTVKVTAIDVGSNSLMSWQYSFTTGTGTGK